MNAVAHKMFGFLGRKSGKYWQIFRVNASTVVVYVTNVLSRSGLVLLRVWIFTQLYRVTYAVAGVETIGGLDVVMVVWALMLTQGFQAAAKPPVAKYIDEEVKSGTLAYSINKPYSYTLFHFFGFVGRSVPNLIINLIAGGVAALILVGPLFLSPQAIAFGLILLIFGYVIDFLMSFSIGLLAFWVEDITPFMWIYQKSQTIFGGVILPLALFPDAIRQVAELLPFAQLYYSAARLMVNFSMDIFLTFIATQAVWIAVFSIVAVILFARGIKQVAINGG